MVRGSTIIKTTMFKCRECGSTEFKLMLQPNFQGSVDIYNNDNHEVVVNVSGKEFIADLMFMNQFSVCAECDAIKAWEYHFPKSETESDLN